MAQDRSRKRDDSLHALVQAMSQQERRYYVLFARQHAHGAESSYLHIFQQLAQMSVYDEAALLESLPDPGQRQRFSATKYQLQAHVLRALRHYHEDRDAARILLNARQELPILFEKGLWKTFDKTLQRAQRLASQHELWADLLGLLDWERTAILHGSANGSTLLQLRAAEQRLTQLLDQENALKSLYMRIRLLTKQRGKPAVQPQEDHLASILQALTEIAPSPPTSLVAAACYHNVLGLAALLENQHATAFDHLNTARLRWFSQPALVGLHQDIFRVSLTNFFNACLFTGNMEAYSQAEEALQQLTDLSSSNRLQLDDLRYYNRLRYCLNRGRFEEGRALVPEIDTWLQRNEQHLDPARVMHFLHNIQLLHFFDDNVLPALRYTRRIQTHGHSDLRADIHAFSFLMELLLLFQTGDLQLLEYRLRAYQRRIRAQKGQELGKAAVGLLNALMANASPTQARFQATAAELAAWEQVRLQQLPFGYWEVRLWVESQAAGLPLREYFRTKLEEP